MPYLPPDGELDPGLTCALIFYPDRAEYRRALFGQLAELTDVWNWEASREDQAIIRRAWLAAELESIRCNDMACLDDILALLAEIRDKDVCCDTVGSVPGGEDIGGVDDSTLPPDVDRDGDSFPDGWTGGATTYDPYLCGQAERLAGTTDEAVDAVYDAILAASNVLVFATLVVLAFGNVIGMGIAAILAGGYTLVTWSEIVGYYSFFTELREALGLDDPDGIVVQTKAELSPIAGAFEKAVYCANDAAEAYATIAALIDNHVTNAAYAALLKLTYQIALRPIFWGFGGAPDSTGCDCVAFFSHEWNFVSDLESWGGEAVWNGGSMTIPSGAANYGDLGASVVKTLGGFGAGISLRPTSLVFDFIINHANGIDVEIGGLFKTFDYPTYATGTWHRDVEVDLTGVNAIDLDEETYFMRIRNMKLTVGSTAWIDNVRLVCDQG